MGNQALYFVALNFCKAVDGNGTWSMEQAHLLLTAWFGKVPHHFTYFSLLRVHHLAIPRGKEGEGYGLRTVQPPSVTTVLYGEGKKIELGN